MTTEGRVPSVDEIRAAVAKIRDGAGINNTPEAYDAFYGSGRTPSRCGVSWDEHPTAGGEPYCEPSSCPARSGRVLTATVGDLRAQVDRLPDIAEILIEMNDGSQFEVRQVRAIGTKTDDPGLILRVERVR